MTAGVPASALELHRTLSPKAAELLADAPSAPEALRTADEQIGDLPEWMRMFPYPVQAWPTVVSGPKLSEIRRASVALPRLVKSLPERIFGADPVQMASFYGFDDPRVLQVILREPNGLDSALGRSDFVDTDDGLRCIEVNLGSSLGGWQIRFMAQGLLALPWLRDLSARVGGIGTYVDPLPALLCHLSREASRSGVATGDELNIALLVLDDEWADRVEGLIEALSRDSSHLIPDLDGRSTGRLLCSSYRNVRLDEAQVVVDGTRIHAAIEFHAPATDPRLFRSFKAGQLNLYNGPIASILSDKRNLALLSENHESDAFDAEERELIRRHIPWTRCARAGSTRFRGEAVALPAFALSDQESLVLKPALGSQGESVFVGDETPRHVWERVVENAFASGAWILQERVRSRSYRYPATGGRFVPHSVVWGMFAFDEVYGGGFLRMMPERAGGVVNAARGASEGMILEVADRA